MKFDLYKKCIDELALFGDQLKVLRFVGMGEPLLHKNIAEMVAYAVSRNVALRVELLTNGSLLTRQMSDKSDCSRAFAPGCFPAGNIQREVSPNQQGGYRF